MIYINKNRTPKGLLGYLENTAKTMQSYEGENKKSGYHSFTKKERGFNGAFDELRTSLVNEQKGICCYCQSRIAFSPKKADGTGLVIDMKTEHFLPKSIDPNGKFDHSAKVLDYSNLLASCLGNSDSKRKNHCDSSKGNKELKYIKNPSFGKKKGFEPVFEYYVILNKKQKEVRIVPIEPNTDLKHDINIILNLNEQNLKESRFRAWKKVDRDLKKNNKGEYTLEKLQEQLKIYKPNPHDKEFEEFCGFITSWLEGKIKSYSK